MRIVMEETEFRQLSPAAQKEILAVLTGVPVTLRSSGMRKAKVPLHWRRPVDITPDQAVRLVHGLSDDHKRRLALFARRDGRVRMKEILALTGDSDLRATSDFQKAMTRRLRRLIDDPDKKAQLIAWDFDATRWDDARTTIVDGVYYVSEATARALRTVLDPKSPSRPARPARSH